MKKFFQPEMDIKYLVIEDVITTSGSGGNANEGGGQDQEEGM